MKLRKLFESVWPLYTAYFGALLLATFLCQGIYSIFSMVLPAVPINGTLKTILTGAAGVLIFPLGAGFLQYCLCIQRGDSAHFHLLTAYYRDRILLKKALTAGLSVLILPLFNFVVDIIIGLIGLVLPVVSGLLLFVFTIAGIVLTLSLFLVRYLFVYHEDWSLSQLILVSMEKMKGSKGRLFLLQVFFAILMASPLLTAVLSFYRSWTPEVSSFFYLGIFVLSVFFNPLAELFFLRFAQDLLGIPLKSAKKSTGKGAKIR